MYSSISSQLAMYNSRTKQPQPLQQTAKGGMVYQPIDPFVMTPQSASRSSLTPMNKPALLPIKFENGSAARAIQYPPKLPPVGMNMFPATPPPLMSANRLNGQSIRSSQRKHRIFDKSASPLSLSRRDGTFAATNQGAANLHRLGSYISTNSIRSNRFYNPTAEEPPLEIPSAVDIPNNRRNSERKTPRNSIASKNKKMFDPEILNQIESRIVMDRPIVPLESGNKSASHKEPRPLEDLGARRNIKSSKASDNRSDHGSDRVHHQRFFDTNKSNFHNQATAPREFVYFQGEARSDKDLKQQPTTPSKEGLLGKLDLQTKAIALSVMLLVLMLLLYELVK